MKNRYRAAAVLLLGLTLCAGRQSLSYAASGPMISGTETDDTPAEGPALLQDSSGDDTETEEIIVTETLLDQTIDYDELEALVRMGNSTVVTVQNSYADQLATYQSAYDSLISARRDMLNKAEELEDEEGDSSLIDAYEQNASIIYNSAKQLKRSINSLTSSSSERSRKRSVWSLVKSAQSVMVSWAEMEAQVQTAEKTEEAMQAALERTIRERTAGLASEDELLQAEKSLLAAQISLQSARDGRDQLKRQLAGLLGKEASQITLGEIREVTESELSSLNLETDSVKAVIADSSVKSAKNSSATGDAQRKLRRQQIAEAEDTVLITAEEQYQEVAALSLQRDAAVAAFGAAEKNYHALQTKFSAGIINRASYLSGEAEYLQKKASYFSAQADLRLMYDSYQWMLKGVD
ncbi:MAG: TolC family protein [Clostridium sp.]|nr:TolC family protein [Clostridium sp.]